MLHIASGEKKYIKGTHMRQRLERTLSGFLPLTGLESDRSGAQSSDCLAAEQQYTVHGKMCWLAERVASGQSAALTLLCALPMSRHYSPEAIQYCSHEALSPILPLTAERLRLVIVQECQRSTVAIRSLRPFFS